MEDLLNKIKYLELRLRDERVTRHRDLSDWKITRNELLLAVKTANEFERMSNERLEEVENEAKNLRQTVKDLKKEVEILKAQLGSAELENIKPEVDTNLVKLVEN